jgi:SAM-dependent methyltransferase
LAQGYRALHHWGQWLEQHFLGSRLLDKEEKQLSRLLERTFGKHAVLIGVPQQAALLHAAKLPIHTLVTPLVPHGKDTTYVEGGLQELPLLTGSIDLVVLPHTLEFVDNPRQLISEACRTIKPEGLLVICGFNPYSTWGIKRLMSKRSKGVTWETNLIQLQKIKNWLKLADFELEKQESVFYVPPVNRPSWYNKLQFLERIGALCFPMMGGVYFIIARAKVIPLTPIRLKWKQQLSGARVSTRVC